MHCHFSIFVSSDQRNDDQELVSLSKGALAKARRNFKCLGWSRGVFLGLYPLRLCLCDVLCSIYLRIFIPELLRLCRIALVMVLGSLLALPTTFLGSLGETFGFVLIPFRFFTVWNFLDLLIILCLVDPETIDCFVTLL